MRTPLSPLVIMVLAGCVRDAPLPFVGDCAKYPDGAYEYGQIEIGSCLAGPTELRFVGDEDDPVLLVTNANPYQDFTGGSLLAIPWAGIDFTVGRNVVSELDAAAVAMPDFAGGLAVAGDLGLVGVRYSEAGLTREAADDVWLVDLSDPRNPALSDRGDDGGPTVQVGADPVDVVYDASADRAYVANRTDHTISVLDIGDDTVTVVQPWPESTLTSTIFFDVDGSGSTAALAELDVEDADLLPDDTWKLTWIEGTWQVWVPGDTGLSRSTTTGTGTYRDSAVGVELDPADSDDEVVEIHDPTYLSTTPGRMFFEDQGTIRAAQTNVGLVEWTWENSVLIEAGDDGWSESIGSPTADGDASLLYLLYDTGDAAGGGQGFGMGSTADGLTFDLADAPVLEATWDHESGGIFDPALAYDGETGRWHLYYGAWDGETWTIGHAESDDLLSWESDEEPVFAIDGVGVAAPVVAGEVGAWRMWYARWEDGWTIGAAESPDGREWNDLGAVLDVALSAPDELDPPGPALDAQPTSAFRVEGEDAGSLTWLMSPGATFEAIYDGWSARAVVGFTVDRGAAGTDSTGGIQADSVDLDAGLAWLTLTDEGGTSRIGVADLDADGELVPRVGAIFEGSSDFDRDGVASPVVFDTGDGWSMIYAGTRGGEVTLGLATSSDGVNWERVGQIFDAGDGWDGVSAVPGSVTAQSTGGWRLWYSGYDGGDRRIGSATSTDGVTWTRETGSRNWQFAGGGPGEWDDSGVADPFVLADEDGDHLWYAGFDGDLWRCGYAFRAIGDTEWQRAADPITDEDRPVITAGTGLFHLDGVRRPVLVPRDDDTWDVWYVGLDGDVARVGKARAEAPDRIHKTPRRPTVGDTLTFATTRGNADAEAIPLDGTIGGVSLTGIGLTSISLDEERGFLYAATKLLPYILVVDVRDDSDPDIGFRDLDYLDLEAALVASSSSGADGFRQVLPVPGTDALYALNDEPESVFVIDISGLEDDEYGQMLYDTPSGWLAASRGNERDQGVDTQMTIGPAQQALHPDGRRLFVTNFNANSVSVYDLTLGPYGQLVAETTLIGENPYAIQLTPDGLHAVIANFAGEVEKSRHSESTLAVLDVDEDSDTYMQVLTWVVNR